MPIKVQSDLPAREILDQENIFVMDEYRALHQNIRPPKGQIRSDSAYQSATQNVLKYTQTHREIEVLADTSYCFNVYALAIINNTLLTSSCTLHSRKFLR